MFHLLQKEKSIHPMCIIQYPLDGLRENISYPLNLFRKSSTHFNFTSVLFPILDQSGSNTLRDDVSDEVLIFEMDVEQRELLKVCKTVPLPFSN